MINEIKGLKCLSSGVRIMTNDERPVDGNGNVDWAKFDEMRDEIFICVDHEKDMISFKMMTSPASEGGKGCQFTDLIEVALHQLKYFNNKFPCRENAISITKLEEALMWQERRTQDRLKRNVEGKDEQ